MQALEIGDRAMAELRRSVIIPEVEESEGKSNGKGTRSRKGKEAPSSQAPQAPKSQTPPEPEKKGSQDPLEAEERGNENAPNTKEKKGSSIRRGKMHRKGKRT